MTGRTLLPLPVLPLLVLAACPAWAQGARVPSDDEARTAIESLLREPARALSEDPSCRSDLSRPGTMTIAQGLAKALARAVVTARPVATSVICEARPGRRLPEGQESCRLQLSSDDDGLQESYGLAFVIDWTKPEVVADSVECF